jgi:VWFA-related protein
MTVLLFDANSLSLNDARFVIDEVVRWVDTQSDAQLTAVVTTGTKLNVVTDFISDRAALTAVLRSDAFLATIVAPSPGQQAIRFGADPTSRAAVQDPAAQADASPELAEARLGGIATMCQTIEAIQQRKAILYFTAGMQSAPSNGSTLRLVTNACNRANASIYPINIRGLRSATGAPRQ